MIASVGTISGPLGTFFRPSVQALQAWTVVINRKGGVNGHPVQLIVYDDGMDPARSRAQVKEAVEQRKVIAFVMNNQGPSGRPDIGYIESKRIPVIGNEGGSPWFYDSPMFFTQASTGDQLYQIAIRSAAAQLVSEGVTQLALISCVEAQQCSDAERVWSSLAAGLGFSVVYSVKSSVTQPDYTAECLNAKSRGAQLVMFAMETNSVVRFAASCARQGYRPRYATVSSVQADRFKTDPNLDRMVGASPVFPYFQSGTPATDEFHSAIDAYAKTIDLGIAAAVGWAAAKLFERAAARLPEPPTNEAVLTGLTGITDDTLEGLTMPLTFVAGRPSTPRSCWFDIMIRDKAWRSFDGFGLHCVP